MRIISKNRDYYDIGMTAGIDRSIVYVRETKIVRQANKRGLNHLSEAVIGFCGKTYPVIYYVEYAELPKKVVHPFYNLENLKVFIKENPKFKGSYYYSDYFTFKWGSWQDFREHFDKYGRDGNDLSNVFVEHKVPIFLYQKYQGKLTLNPILADWQFYRILDAWSAFQEISTYISNILVEPSKPIPIMKDEAKAEIHGFDKYSFRKDKTPK